MKVNTEVLETLNPCGDRMANWTQHYSYFNGDLVDFLSLGAITPRDKIWVAVRLLPRDLVEIFAMDCAVSAQKHASASTPAAAYAAAAEDACDAAYDAAYAATAAAAYAAAAAEDACDAAASSASASLKEQENQVDALIHLAKGM